MQRLNRSEFSVRRDGNGVPARPAAALAARAGGVRAAGPAGGGGGGRITAAAASREITERLHSFPLFFSLFPLPFSNFGSSIFTCKTLHAVIRKHLTCWTAFQSNLIKSNVYRASLHATKTPRDGKPRATEPPLAAGEQQRRRGGEQEMASLPACSHPLLRRGSSQLPGTGRGDITLPSPRERLQRGQRSAKRQSEAGPQPRTRGRWPRGGAESRAGARGAGAESLITSARRCRAIIGSFLP